MQSKKIKVVFFSPFSFIWPHALPEYQLATILHQEGFEIVVIGCGKSYAGFCTSMEAAGLSIDAAGEEKAAICERCVQSHNLLAKNFADINFQLIESYGGGLDIDEDCPREIDEILTYEEKGVSVGRLALYETLIKFKKKNMFLSDFERRHFELSFKNARKVLYQAEKALENERPDIVVCYSPQYVIPGIFAAVANREDIRVIFIEGSSNDVERYSHLRMWDWEVHGLSQPALAVTERFDTYQLTRNGAKRAEKLMEVRAKATAFSSYTSASSGASPYEVFGLDSARKYFLMAMSSYDEVYSGYIIGKLPLSRYQGQVFKDQTEWLKATVAWFREHPELQLVVRPHPREFPNRREGVLSANWKEWSSVLQKLPANVKVDHPDQKFSLYDHLSNVAVVITGWSSVAVEALSAGIPVVTYDEKLPTFPPSMQYTGASVDEYFENILNAYSENRKKHFKHEAKRWLAYTSEVGTVEVGGRIEDRFNVLKKVKLRRSIFELGCRYFDLKLPPSRKDVRRICSLFLAEGSSLFELPHEES
jgi:hypothetical protein